MLLSSSSSLPSSASNSVAADVYVFCKVPNVSSILISFHADLWQKKSPVFLKRSDTEHTSCSYDTLWGDDLWDAQWAAKNSLPPHPHNLVAIGKKRASEKENATHALACNILWICFANHKLISHGSWPMSEAASARAVVPQFVVVVMANAKYRLMLKCH